MTRRASQPEYLLRRLSCVLPDLFQTRHHSAACQLRQRDCRILCARRQLFEEAPCAAGNHADDALARLSCTLRDVLESAANAAQILFGAAHLLHLRGQGLGFLRQLGICALVAAGLLNLVHLADNLHVTLAHILQRTVHIARRLSLLGNRPKVGVPRLTHRLSDIDRRILQMLARIDELPRTLEECVIIHLAVNYQRAVAVCHAFTPTMLSVGLLLPVPRPSICAATGTAFCFPPRTLFPIFPVSFPLPFWLAGKAPAPRWNP